MRTCSSGRPRQPARPVRTTCGICVEVCSTSWSTRLSHSATQPRPSSGDMHCRAVRSVRRTTIGAVSRTAEMSPSTRVSSTMLSPQDSCTKAVSGARACNMSVTAGSSSKSTSTAAARSSASARVGAMQTAMGSPTWRTLSCASTGCCDGLKPGNALTATIGETPARSAAVNTKPSGLRIARMRAWATGLRTKASSCMPASRMSATNTPRPRR